MRLRKRIEILERTLRDHTMCGHRGIPDAVREAVECSKCGVFVGCDSVIKGKEKIRTRTIRSLGGWRLAEEKYIYTPKYCTRCAPKSKKTKKGGKR